MRRDEVIRRLEQCAAEFERFGVVSVRLFGSTARDEADDGSDLEEQLETKVDLVTERGLRDRVRPQVERDAIRVA